MELTRLTEICKPIRIVGRTEREVAGVEIDSRKVGRDCMFVAMKGTQVDGHAYIEKAIQQGASIIVCEEIPETVHDDVTYMQYESTEKIAGTLATHYQGNPTGRMSLIGVTGTNGKTTIATLLFHIFRRLGYKCGLCSTVCNYIDDKAIPTEVTTPDPITLNRLLGQMADEGCQFAFMEVSSHSVAQHRISGLTFAGGIFTNLTRDHLDYHKTFENYRNCKKRFFDMLDPDAFALINIDDRNGEFMVQNTQAQVHTYSTRNVADYKTRIIEQSIDGMQLNINGTELWSNLIGEYNAENLTAIYGAAMLLGAPHDQLVQIMSSLKSVSGRLEYLRGDDDIIAAVDYAHTPDALENVLKTLKALKPKGDLICVFGCGGDRDKTKRPEMGAIAGNYADRIFVTSDNPRTEDPMAIIENIKAGMDADTVLRTKFIPDRIQAIQNAVTSARPGSIILVAGKGHEDYQIIGTEKHHMDDRETVKEALRLRNDNNLR